MASATCGFTLDLGMCAFILKPKLQYRLHFHVFNCCFKLALGIQMDQTCTSRQQASMAVHRSYRTGREIWLILRYKPNLTLTERRLPIFSVAYDAPMFTSTVHIHTFRTTAHQPCTCTLAVLVPTRGVTIRCSRTKTKKIPRVQKGPRPSHSTPPPSTIQDYIN